jgi:hypothetical protein
MAKWDTPATPRSPARPKAGAGDRRRDRREDIVLPRWLEPQYAATLEVEGV